MLTKILSIKDWSINTKNMSKATATIQQPK